MKEIKSLNKEVLNLLINYFETEVPLLERRYSWKIPKIDGFLHSMEKGFSANVKLKYFLNSLWKQENKSDFEVAKIIIKDWGGVKGNKDETIKKYINRVRSGNFEMPFKGLASYTKLYSIVEPKRFAIFDARVVVTLNALQCNANISSGIVFNYLEGRNNVTGNKETKKGFSQQKEHSVASLVKRGWERIAKEDTYQVYLDYLFACIKHNPDWKLYELEMVLFANAEEEAKKAIENILGNEKTICNLEQAKAKEKVSAKKRTHHQALFEHVTKQNLLSEKFSYSKVLSIAQLILDGISKSGQHYAALKFIQNYCIALDESISNQLKAVSDPRQISALEALKNNCEFKLA